MLTSFPRAWLHVKSTMIARQTHNWNGGGGHGYYCRGIVIVGFKDGALLMSRKFKATTNALTCQVEVDRSAVSFDTELMAHVRELRFVFPCLTFLMLSLS